MNKSMMLHDSSLRKNEQISHCTHTFFSPDCGALLAPDHGSVDMSSGRALGDVAVYACDTGYQLKGSDRRTCLPIGNWSLSAPQCELWSK